MATCRQRNKTGRSGNCCETKTTRLSRFRLATSMTERPCGGTFTGSAQFCSEKNRPSESGKTPTGIPVRQRASERLEMKIRLDWAKHERPHLNFNHCSPRRPV